MSSSVRCSYGPNVDGRMLRSSASFCEPSRVSRSSLASTAECARLTSPAPVSRLRGRPHPATGYRPAGSPPRVSPAGPRCAAPEPGRQQHAPRRRALTVRRVLRSRPAASTFARRITTSSSEIITSSTDNSAFADRSSSCCALDRRANPCRRAFSSISSARRAIHSPRPRFSCCCRYTSQSRMKCSSWFHRGGSPHA